MLLAEDLLAASIHRRFTFIQFPLPGRSPRIAGQVAGWSTHPASGDLATEQARRWTYRGPFLFACTRYISWCDSRCGPAIRHIHCSLSWLEPSRSESLRARTVQLVLLRAALSHGPVLVADFLPLLRCAVGVPPTAVKGVNGTMQPDLVTRAALNSSAILAGFVIHTDFGDVRHSLFAFE
jgi:hypothetical protein